MRDRLSEILEKADLAIASSSGVLDAATLDPLIESVRGVRTRLAYPEDVMVVALAGGTGSGKSSLFNALAAADLVDVGGVRPTTSHPAAGVPRSMAGAIAGYLDRLGIEERHLHDHAGWCLLDLPDTDSVEVEHHHRVDSILPFVDVVVWVTDPEKYHDARLHHDYVRPMAGYSDQLIFVLNQVDRLTPDQIEEVAADLAAALVDDDIHDPTVIATAASPLSGPPMRVDVLGDALEAKRLNPEALYGKLLTDLAGTARRLEAAAGVATDFDARADLVTRAATSALAEGDAESAANGLMSFLDALAAEIGGSTGEKLAQLASDVPRHVARVATQSGPGRRRGWFARLRPVAGPDPELVSRSIKEEVIRPARAIVAQRAVALAAVTDLAVDVERLRSSIRR